MYQKRQIYFTSGGVWNRDTQNRRLGMSVTSFQDFKLSGKQISQPFSYFLINNVLLYHFLANWLAHKEKMAEKSFLRSLKSWNDVTFNPSLLFLVSRFCTPPEVKFDAFGTSKHGKGKWLWKKNAILITTLGIFHRGNKKKICHIHFNEQAPVAQRLDNAIHRINRYPADKELDKCWQNKPSYPPDSDLSGG